MGLESFALLQQQDNQLQVRSMGLAYAEYNKSTAQDVELVSRVALRGLQCAMSTYDDVLRFRNGSGPTQWKYVYFAEPGLSLQMRPSALRASLDALRSRVLLVAHRLEPIPRAESSPHPHLMDRVLADMGASASVPELDH